MDQAESEAAKKALAYCMKQRLYRATDFVDALEYFSKTRESPHQPTSTDVKLLTGTDSAKMRVKPQIRDLGVYQRILEGGRP